MKTKSLLFAALLFVIGSVAAHAQNYRNSRYYDRNTGRLNYSQPTATHSHYAGYDRTMRAPYSYVGLRIGPTFSTVTSDDYAMKASSARTGLNVGLATGVAMSRYTPIYFESGFYYTQKGGKSSGADAYSFNLDYLEVPLTVKYVIMTAPQVSIQPYLGGYLAYGVNGKIKDYDYNKVYSAFGGNGDFQRFDGGLKVGCGLNYDVLYAEIAYEYGLSDISRNDLSSTHNSSVMLNVGLNF